MPSGHYCLGGVLKKILFFCFLVIFVLFRTSLGASILNWMILMNFSSKYLSLKLGGRSAFTVY